MYPILSGIIVGQSGPASQGTPGQKSSGTARSFLLSVAFVLGMAVTYTALGAVFAAAGAQVQAIMQKPAVTIGVALLLLRSRCRCSDSLTCRSRLHGKPG